jgi:hypothetical protein
MSALLPEPQTRRQAELEALRYRIIDLIERYDDDTGGTFGDHSAIRKQMLITAIRKEVGV